MCSEENAFNLTDFFVQAWEGIDAVVVGVIVPEICDAVAAGDGGGGGFVTAGIGRVAVVEADGGAALHPDDGGVAAEFGREIGVEFAPVIVGTVGPVGGAVDGPAIEEEGFTGVGLLDFFFLLELEMIDFPLDVAAAGGGQFVPPGLEGIIDLSGGFGDENPKLGMLFGQEMGDDGFAGAGGAGEDETNGERVFG